MYSMELFSAQVCQTGRTDGPHCSSEMSLCVQGFRPWFPPGCWKPRAHAARLVEVGTFLFTPLSWIQKVLSNPSKSHSGPK